MFFYVHNIYVLLIYKKVFILITYLIKLLLTDIDQPNILTSH